MNGMNQTRVYVYGQILRILAIYYEFKEKEVFPLSLIVFLYGTEFVLSPYLNGILGMAFVV